MREFSEDIDILSLELFDAAFPVPPDEEDMTRQRFMTLFEHESHTRRGGSATVSRVTNLYGETFALKRLRVAKDSNGSSGSGEPPSDAPASPPGNMPARKELRSSLNSDRGTGSWQPGQTPDYVTRGHVAALYEEYRVHLAVSRLRGYPDLYGFGFSNGDPVIVMEWVEGASLHDAVQGAGPLPLQAVADLGIAVLDLLARSAELSERFVHRDLSPRNIMLRTDRTSADEQIRTGEFDLCLIDFGSSALGDGAADPTFTARHDIWRMGTPSYAPPEMLSSDIALPRGWRQSPTIDTYALCSILYELYAGFKPYDLPRASANRGGAGPSENEVPPHAGLSPYRLKTETKPAPLEPREPDGGALAAIIETGLSAQQDDRPTVLQLKAALENWKRLPSQRRIGALRGAKPADAAFWQPGYARKAVARRSFVAAGIVALGAIAAGAIAAPKLFAPADPFDPSRYAVAGRRYDGPPLFKAFDGQHPGWMLCAEDGSIACKPASSRECGALRGGLAALYDDISQRYGYIVPNDGPDGYAWAILPAFAQAGDFAEELAPAQDRETKLWGYIDADGSWAIAPQFRAARGFSNGAAAAQSASEPPLWGAIDPHGAWVVQPAFTALGSFSADGHAVAAQDSPDGEWGIIDPQGRWTCAARFSRLRSCANGPAPAFDEATALWGFVDTSGAWVIAPAFRDARPFHPDGDRALAAVQDESTQLWLFIEEDGTPHGGMQPRFWKLGDLHDGLAPAQATAQDSTLALNEEGPSSRVRGIGKRYGYVDAAGAWHLKRLTTLTDTAIGPAAI